MCLALSEASAAEQALGQKVEGPPECRLSCSTPGGLLLELTSLGQVRAELLSQLPSTLSTGACKHTASKVSVCTWKDCYCLPVPGETARNMQQYAHCLSTELYPV